ncbi:MAG TPA: hypothetical protein VFA70_11325, partial [Dehalococcoidia bacterium]|nr:hypothetical protein [Dehalococcoidia bacterium]
ACPSPWSCTDVGAGSPIGDQTVSNGVWTVSGEGEGVEGVQDGYGTQYTYDQFHFVYQTMPGDGTVTARLTGLTNGNANDQAIVMMRSDLTEGSPFYGVVVKPNGTATVEWRRYNGVQQRETVSVGTITFPTWFQINRYTDTSHSPTTTYYSLLTSSNGTTWSQVNGSTVALNLGANPLAGFGGDTQNPRIANPSTWDNVGISGTSTPPPGVCPPAYSCTDVGGGYFPGSQEYNQSNNTWAFQAGGSDIWDVYDGFHYVYQTMNNDGTLSAEVVSAGPANYDAEWEKAGVMLRASTDPQAPYYGAFITPQHGLTVQWRTASGQPTNQVQLASAPTYPIYLMVTRWTDPHPNGLTYFTAYYSTDNKNFTEIPGSSIPMSSLNGTVLAGLAADSYNEKTTYPVNFANFAIFDNTEDPPPGACPSSVAGCADVGGATPPGTQTLSGTTLTMNASGGDIWDGSDQFHYVWQNLSADGAVSAEVTAQQNIGPWEKAGVMMRSEAGTGGAADATAPYYAAFVTPSNGVAVQWRNAEGAQTAQILVPGAVPVYLKVTRFTDSGGNQNFAAFTSPDGTNWTWVSGSTVQLPLTGTIAAGWAANSYSDTTSSQVTFSNIAEGAGAQVGVGVCPAGYTCTDVGGATPAGSQTANGSSWTVYGGGGDIWDASDQFHYVYQPMTTDGTVSADVVSQQNSNAWAKAGVMMRGTTDPSSPYYAVFMTPSNGVAVQWRTTQGGSTSQVVISGVTPEYLAVVRWTDTSTSTPVTYYYAETSADGSTWTVIPGSVQQLTLPSSFLAGIAVTSHTTTQLSMASFNAVGIGTTANPPAGICEQAYTCADIGGATPAGTQSFTNNGTWTVQGGGGDIWSTSDQFRYIYTSLPGDGTASVRVNSLSNASPNPWAKAGVMLRLSNDPAAPYYAVLVTPGNGIAVQYRPTSGASTSLVQVPYAFSSSNPVYLQITRSGTTTFNAAYSTDGTTWTAIAGSTVSIPALTGSLLDGMALTSHDTSNLITAVFDKLNL